MDTGFSCRDATPLIWERAAGDLPSDRADALRAHLDQCQRCREEARRAERAFELLAAIDQPVTPRPDGWDRLYRRLTTPVVPFWRRITAPALTSAAAMAAVFALAIGQVVSVGPGPREVVVLDAHAQPETQPGVTITHPDGTVAASTSLGGNLTLGSWPTVETTPPTQPVPPPKVKRPGRSGGRTGGRTGGANGGGSNGGPVVVPPPPPPPVAPRAPVVLAANRVGGAGEVGADLAAPPATSRPRVEPAVHYERDRYTGDYVGRPIGGSGI